MMQAFFAYLGLVAGIDAAGFAAPTCCLSVASPQAFSVIANKDARKPEIIEKTSRNARDPACPGALISQRN
jgi:hypothetical protein